MGNVARRTSPGTRYRGQGPTSWAHLTARLQGEAERSLADEAAGPLAQIIPHPTGTDTDDDDDDPLAGIRKDLKSARGRAILVETVAAAFGEGKGQAPQRDWVPSRLGPTPPDAMVAVADAAFGRMLAACGCSAALFDDSDGTAKREALRQWHLGTVRPLARLLEHELSARLDAPIRLRFDSYPRDMVSRAQVFAKLIAAEGVTVEKALAIAGLLEDE